MLRKRELVLSLVVLAMLASRPAGATRIGDLCDVQGARPNMLIGTGIVVGLAGTGDKNPAAVIAQQRVMERLGIAVDSLKELKSDNSAIVTVTAELPAFAKEGTQIDVSVASVYNCKSLEGGTLLETHLTGPGGDGTVYVVAQGPVSIGGFNASAGGGGGGSAAVRKNHATVGRIPMGGYVENEVPSTITDGERIMLLLKRPDFTTATNVTDALNKRIAPECADAFGAGTVSVTIPEQHRADLVSFIAMVQSVETESGYASSIAINEKTGTVVVGANVMIKPCQVAHGNLTISIAKIPAVSQPNPFSETGETKETSLAQVEASEDNASLLPVQGTSAGEVAAALNRLRVTPRDVISIFQALRVAGALEADIEVM